MSNGITYEEAVSRFGRVCDNARAEQEILLERILRRNAHTVFGEKHGFSDISGAPDYRRAVPLSEFGDYESSMSRIQSGESNILTSEPAVFFNISAGTTGEPKYVPLCREDIEKQHLYEDLTVSGIIKEALPQYDEDELFGCIFNIGDFFDTYMPDGRMNGVRSGAYFRLARSEGELDTSMFVSPEKVMFSDRIEDLTYVKLRFALQREDLTAIHGVFVHRLVSTFRFLETHWDEFLYDTEHSTVSECFGVDERWRRYITENLPPDKNRAEELRALDRSSLADGMLRRIWKNLKYIRVISGRSFSAFTDMLARYAGGAALHSFAYASSESNIGIAPYVGVTDEYVLLPDVCFFEFIPEDQTADPRDMLTISEVEAGKRYELVITTLSGLYRYRIGDVVEVTGFYGEAPKVMICYRKNLAMNITDERVNMMMLENAMNMFSEKTGISVADFCVRADYGGQLPRYVMYLETDKKPDALASELLDRCLRRCSPGYDTARGINDLDRAELRTVRAGTFRGYEELCRKNGRRTEQAKLLRVLTDEEQVGYFESSRE